MLSGSTLLSMALVIPPSPLPNTRYARVPASDLDAAYAIEAAGFKLARTEMTGTNFYFSRLFEAVKA